MAKKLFPGLILAIAKGIPTLFEIIKPLIKKKPIPVEELNSKPTIELVSIIQEEQTRDNEPWYNWVLKRVVTLGTVYFIIWAAKQLGVTYQDIMSLFGIIGN